MLCVIAVLQILQNLSVMHAKPGGRCSGVGFESVHGIADLRSGSYLDQAVNQNFKQVLGAVTNESAILQTKSEKAKSCNVFRRSCILRQFEEDYKLLKQWIRLLQTPASRCL
jgi:hypothetical protein